MNIDNIEETKKLIQQMNEFFTYIERTNSDLKNSLVTKELEQSDLLHELELSKLNAIEIIKVSTKLIKVRKERRNIKDRLEFIATLKEFTDKYNKKLITGDIAKALKDIDTLKNNWETRYYRPRVLSDLKICKMKGNRENGGTLDTRRVSEISKTEK